MKEYTSNNNYIKALTIARPNKDNKTSMYMKLKYWEFDIIGITMSESETRSAKILTVNCKH